jgi:hypothetical protein
MSDHEQGLTDLVRQDPRVVELLAHTAAAETQAVAVEALIATVVSVTVEAIVPDPKLSHSGRAVLLEMLEGKEYVGSGSRGRWVRDGAATKGRAIRGPTLTGLVRRGVVERIERPGQQPLHRLVEDKRSDADSLVRDKRRWR